MKLSWKSFEVVLFPLTKNKKISVLCWSHCDNGLITVNEINKSHCWSIVSESYKVNEPTSLCWSKPTSEQCVYFLVCEVMAAVETSFFYAPRGYGTLSFDSPLQTKITLWNNIVSGLSPAKCVGHILFENLSAIKQCSLYIQDRVVDSQWSSAFNAYDYFQTTPLIDSESWGCYTRYFRTFEPHCSVPGYLQAWYRWDIILDESVIVNALKLTQSVLNLDDKQLESCLKDHIQPVASNLVAWTFGFLVWPYPYIPDLNPYGDERGELVEYMDDVQTNRAGDCEDFARSIIGYVQKVRNSDAWRNPFVQLLSTFLNYYTPVIAHSCISNGVQSSTSETTEQHITGLLIPNGHLREWIKYDSELSTFRDSLLYTERFSHDRVILLEGTATSYGCYPENGSFPVNGESFCLPPQENVHDLFRTLTEIDFALGTKLPSGSSFPVLGVFEVGEAYGVSAKDIFQSGERNQIKLKVLQKYCSKDPTFTALWYMRGKMRPPEYVRSATSIDLKQLDIIRGSTLRLKCPEDEGIKVFISESLWIRIKMV